MMSWSPLSSSSSPRIQPSNWRFWVVQHMSFSCCSVLFLFLLPITSGIRCARCEAKNQVTAFGQRYTCDLPDPWESLTCGCDEDCNCGPDSPARTPYVTVTCELNDLTQCSCDRVEHLCPAAQKTTAYRCDDSLYVCWNMVPPEVLDPIIINSPITTLIYCDGDGNPSIQFDGDFLCGTWCDTANTATMCPNEKAIDQKFHITAPPDKEGYPSDFIAGVCGTDCITGFCDYDGQSQTDGWVVYPDTCLTGDVEPPTVTCPANMDIVAPERQCFSVVTYNPPVATDNCDGLEPPKVQLVPGHGYPSGTIFPVGVTTVTFDATDPSNNKSTCSFQVQVTNPSVDCTRVPNIICPTNMVVNQGPGQCGAVVVYSVVTKNPLNVFAKVKPVLTHGLKSGSLFPIGTTELLYTASRVGIAGCSFTVTVNGESSGCANKTKKNKNTAIRVRAL